jgi:hypothetical protein
VPGTQLKIAIANCLQSLAGAFKQFIPKLGRDQSSRHGFAEIDGLHVRFIPIFCHFRRAIPVSPDGEVIAVGTKKRRVMFRHQCAVRFEVPFIWRVNCRAGWTPGRTFRWPGDR